MEQTSHFTSLLIVAVLAFVIPLLLSRFKRLRLPIVVGEILAGVIIGRSGFGWVPSDQDTLNFLAEFGFIFLMFLSGMEIDFSNLGFNKDPAAKQSGRTWGPMSLALISFLLTLVISSIIGYILFRFNMVRSPIMMALILSTTSLGVVVPVLKETGLVNSRYGQTLLVSALIADFVTMFLITTYVAILSRGLTLEITLIGLLFIAFFFMYRFGLFFNRIPAVRKTLDELSHATAQIKIRAAFAIMLIFIVLSEFLGTEIILGAFLAGAIVALLMTPADAEVTHQLEAFGYGFLIPIFFIKVGVDLDLSLLAESPQAMILIPVLLGAAIVVKIFPALLFRLSFSMRETLAAGALLSSRLSLIIAAAAIGTRLGVISDAVNAAIILVAIVTVTVSPIIFMRILPPRKHPEERPSIVIGAGELGLQVTEQLLTYGDPVIILDPDENRVARARQHGFTAVIASVEDNDPRATAFLEKSKSVICTYNDTERNYCACRVARLTYGIPNIVAHIAKPTDSPRFEQIGIRTTNAALDHSSLMVLLLRNPSIYNLLLRADGSKEMCEVPVSNYNLSGNTLRQLRLPGDVLVVAVRRNGEILVPHGNTQLQGGDYVTLAGSTEWIEYACGLFSGSS